MGDFFRNPTIPVTVREEFRDNPFWTEVETLINGIELGGEILRKVERDLRGLIQDHILLLNNFSDSATKRPRSELECIWISSAITPVAGISPEVALQVYEQIFGKSMELLREAPDTYPRVLEALRRETGRQFQNSLVRPGFMAGSIVCDSIMEPAMQGSLNAFHNVGVGANIASGVDRTKAIINMSKVENPVSTIFFRRLMTMNEILEQRIRLIDKTLGDFILHHETDLLQELNLNLTNSPYEGTEENRPASRLYFDYGAVLEFSIDPLGTIEKFLEDGRRAILWEPIPWTETPMGETAPDNREILIIDILGTTVSGYRNLSSPTGGLALTNHYLENLEVSSASNFPGTGWYDKPGFFYFKGSNLPATTSTVVRMYLSMPFGTNQLSTVKYSNGTIRPILDTIVEELIAIQVGTNPGGNFVVMSTGLEKAEAYREFFDNTEVSQLLYRRYGARQLRIVDVYFVENRENAIQNFGFRNQPRRVAAVDLEREILHSIVQKVQAEPVNGGYGISDLQPENLIIPRIIHQVSPTEDRVELKLRIQVLRRYGLIGENPLQGGDQLEEIFRNENLAVVDRKLDRWVDDLLLISLRGQVSPNDPSPLTGEAISAIVQGIPPVYFSGRGMGGDMGQLLTDHEINPYCSYVGDINVIQEILGIEAARTFDIMSLASISAKDDYSLSLDYRHLLVHADFVTRSGQLSKPTKLGNYEPNSDLEKASSRDPIKKIRNSVLTPDYSDITGSLMVGVLPYAGSVINPDLLKPQQLTPGQALETITEEPEELVADIIDFDAL